ncbi:unnamed protein product [Discula destructiva]
MRSMHFTAAVDPEWQPGERTDWEYYRGDLKASKITIRNPRPRIEFEIPILPRPPRYGASSAPPSGTIDLHLESDAHLDANQQAFIVDKVILPLEPFTELNDPRQRRAYYIIGWPDLPGARPVIDCTKAPEYVSPHAIEEWEYENFLRREEEKERAEAEAAIAAVAAAIAAEQDKGAAGSAGGDPRILLNGNKKPGRKPKNARLLEARAPTPQLDSEQEAMLARRKQHPSLSTPQKSRIAQLDAELEMDLLDSAGESMDEDEDAEDQVRRQLESEARSEIADTMDEYDVEDEVDLVRPGQAAPGFQSSSQTSSVRPPLSGQLGSFGCEKAPGFRSAHAPFRSSVQQHYTPQRHSEPVVPDRLSQTQRPLSTTPIPLPKRPEWASYSGVPSSSAQIPVPSIETRSPVQGRGQALKLAHAAPNPRPILSKMSSSAPPPLSNGNNGFTPTNSFTPFGRSLSRPPKRAAEDSKESPSLSTKVKTERRKKAPKLSQTPPISRLPGDLTAESQVPAKPQPEQEYVVKRLEGDSILDGIHYFRVRWEGDWPADQNPTWEPAENISAKLVKGYLKRKADKEAKQRAKNTPPVKDAATGVRQHSSNAESKQKHNALKDWASQLNYSSVSEAFEGQAELDQTGQTWEGDGAHIADELAGEADDFLIVDQKRSQEAAAEKRKSFIALRAQVESELAKI